MNTFPPTELVLDKHGKVYHLGISPDALAEKIILVGDQDRVTIVSSLFESIEFRSQNREFVCHTGYFNGKRITALSTGIGTDNIDITLNELDALANIDFKIRTELPNKKSLEIVRIGTCGILQKSIPLHSYIISDYALGLDNVAHFYQIEYSEKELYLQVQLSEFLNLPKAIVPYVSAGDETIAHRLQSSNSYSGITVTASGFYGPQGRQLRLKNSTENLQLKLGQFNMNGLLVCNFEMESSALFVLGKALGHRCSTICLGIANRPNLEFSKEHATEMKELILHVLEKI